MKRRAFITAAGAAGAVTACTASARKPAILPRRLDRDSIRVGIVGLGPYSAADRFIRLINDPSVPPRTNMRVTAVCERTAGYRGLFRGSDDFIDRQSALLAERFDMDRFRTEFGVEHIVPAPRDMIGQVDAVIVTESQAADGDARLFMESGLPVCVAAPFARTLGDARELARYAAERGVMLMGGSYLPWTASLQTASDRIDRNTVQHYYTESAADTLLTGLFHTLDMARALAGGHVIEISTHGVRNSGAGDPATPPPVTAYLVHEPAGPDRDRIVGSASTWYGRPNDAWVKVFTDSGAVEEHVGSPSEKYPEDRGHEILPYLGIVDRAFETGVAPRAKEYVVEITALMLMAHQSATRGGTPVGHDEIDACALPDVVSESV